MKRIINIFFAIILAILALSVVSGASVADYEPSEQPIDVKTDNAEIHLQTQKTTVGHDEPVIITLSATNYVTNNENLNIQLILLAPSGSNVFESSGIKEGSGSQFTTTKTLKPGEQENMRIHVYLNNPGKYNITGQAVYYLGDSQDDSTNGSEITIPIEQSPEPLTFSEKAINYLSNFDSSFTIFVTTIVFFMLIILFSRIAPSNTQSIIMYGGVFVLVISVIIAGIGSLGLISNNPSTIEDTDNPNYQNTNFSLTDEEFKMIYDRLSDESQQDISLGNQNSDQYQAWFGSDPYEDLLDVNFKYREDPNNYSELVFHHRLGDDITYTRVKLNRIQTAQEIYTEIQNNPNIG